MNKNNKLPAFTLTEIMVVLAIIGILTLIALPNLTGLFTQAYEIEAKTNLKHIHGSQINYRRLNFKFNDDFTSIGFEAPKTIKENGNARYEYEVVKAEENAFIARATAIADFDGDGVYNVWEINQDGNLQRIVAD